jgi:nucleoside-diphosphate-sugar epimerase
MKVFVAGAAGAIGAQLVPLLVERGHDVVGMTRSQRNRALVDRLGARPVIADALDREAVLRAVTEARPEVVVHELTALTGKVNMRRIDRFMAQTNRLRTEGTDHLLAAAEAVGARRVIAQSFTGWPFERVGGPVKSEAAPLDPAPPAALRDTLAAIRYLERAVTEIRWAEGVALRYGTLYGPGTDISSDPDATLTKAVLRRQVPIVGDGAAVWSFVHVADAASATVQAVEYGAAGIYNVVDDEPAPMRDWLPTLAEALHARPPRRVPRWVARMVAGEAAAVWFTEIRGASNHKSKHELGWLPDHATWRTGFAEALGGVR